MSRRIRWWLCVGIGCLFSAMACADEALWKLYLDQFQVYRRKGASREAEKAALAALAEAEKSGRPNELVLSCNGVGALYYEAGRYADAEKQFQRALSVQASSSLDYDPEVARARNNLGLVYLRMGRLEEAEKLLLQV